MHTVHRVTDCTYHIRSQTSNVPGGTRNEVLDLHAQNDQNLYHRGKASLPWAEEEEDSRGPQQRSCNLIGQPFLEARAIDTNAYIHSLDNHA